MPLESDREPDLTLLQKRGANNLRWMPLESDREPDLTLLQKRGANNLRWMPLESDRGSKYQTQPGFFRLFAVFKPLEFQKSQKVFILDL